MLGPKDSYWWRLGAAMDDTTPTTEAPPRLVAFRSDAGETLVLTEAALRQLAAGGSVMLKGWPQAEESPCPPK